MDNFPVMTFNFRQWSLRMVRDLEMTACSMSMKHRHSFVVLFISSHFPEKFNNPPVHNSDVILSTMASQITRVSIVYSTVCTDANERKHQSSASLAFVGAHKGPIRWKMFLLIMSSCGRLTWNQLPLNMHKCDNTVHTHLQCHIMNIWAVYNTMHNKHAKIGYISWPCIPFYNGHRRLKTHPSFEIAKVYRYQIRLKFHILRYCNRSIHVIEIFLWCHSGCLATVKRKHAVFLLRPDASIGIPSAESDCLYWFRLSCYI